MRAVRFWGFWESLARLIPTFGGGGFLATFLLGTGTASGTGAGTGAGRGSVPGAGTGSVARAVGIFFAGAVGIFFAGPAFFGGALGFFGGVLCVLAICFFRTGSSILSAANFRIAVASFAARLGCIRLSPRENAPVVDILEESRPSSLYPSLSSPSFAPFVTPVPFFGALRATPKSIRFSNSNDHVHLPASRQSASIVHTMFWIS